MKNWLFIICIILPSFQAYAQEQKNRQELSPEFKDTIKTQLPMSPAEIREFNILRLEALRAQAERPKGPVAGIAENREFSYEPGRAGEAVNLVTGRITAISFLDSLGTSWPIAVVKVGAGALFDVDIPIEGGNSITISPIKEYAQGNIAVYLKDQNEPIIISLLTNEKEYHERLNISVGGYSPEAIVETRQINPKNIFLDKTPLYEILSGKIPGDAKKLEVTGEVFLRAWLYKGKMFLKMKAALVRPAWDSTAPGGQGYKVYSLGPTSNITVSSGGQLYKMGIKING